MFKFYPISEEVKKCNHFTVKINGQVIESYSCTVSAIPFNRLWPGYQRSLDQTEEASFIYFDTDEIVNIELEANKAFSEVVIRPLSKKIQPEIKGRNIKFSAGVGQYTVELDGHHNALHIFINPIKEYDVNIEDENVLYFGPGVHHPGHVLLKSGDTLFIDGGAVVHGTFYAENSDNIKIIGRGIIDGSSFERFDPTPMRLFHCNNTVIEGIIFKDSNEWTLTAVNCENLIIDNTKVIGMWRYNSDGFDICNSSNVTIRNCFVRAFDDAIVFKGLRIVKEGLYNATYPGSDLRNVENHLVENCVVWCDWGRALEIGAETCADEYVNIVYKNCDVIHTDSVAMDIQNGDRANVHNVLYENINVEYSKYWTNGLIQNSDDEKYIPKNVPHIPPLLYAEVLKCMWSQDKESGHIHDIMYKNINVYMDEGLKLPPIIFKGFSDENLVKNVSIENLVINGSRYTEKTDFAFAENEYAKNITLN